MRIGFFDPYLDTLGGGERYTLTLAEYWLSQGHQVEIFWPEKETLERASARFNLRFQGLQYNPRLYRLFSQPAGFRQRRNNTRVYDLIFYLSDGSLPFLFSQKKIIHFQVPFTGVHGRSLLNQLKLRQVNAVVCNSFFTKKFIDREFNIQSQVIYPPVAIEEFSAKPKKNIILSVARFDSPLHAKKQNILLSAFKEMEEAERRGWRLILAGGVQARAVRKLEKLKKSAQGLSVEILANVDFSTLQNLYGEAKIYWHAAGFGVNEEKSPEKVEHFGIGTVEAMAAGCVPVVCAKGGQKEIVDQALDGFLWQKKKELLKYTRELMINEGLRSKLARRGQQKSKKFSKKVFCQQFEELIK